MKIAARPNREGLLEFYNDAELYWLGERITPIDIFVVRASNFLRKRRIKKLVKARLAVEPK